MQVVLFQALFSLILLQNNNLQIKLFKFMVCVRKHPKLTGFSFFLCFGPEFFVFWPSKGQKNPKNIKKAINDMFYMSPMSTEASTAHPKYHFLLGLWNSQQIHEVFTLNVSYFFLHSHLSVYWWQIFQKSFNFDTPIQ